jgi:Flp pilus assembly pilin Flp
MSQKPSIKTLVRDTEGLSTVEYIILLVLVAVIAIAAWRTFGDTVRSKVTRSTGRIQNDLDPSQSNTN